MPTRPPLRGLHEENGFMRARISALASASLLVSVVLLGLALADSASAQAREHEKVNIAVTGDITALDPATRSITIKSTNDEGVAYTVDGSATIMRGATNIKLEDLKVGWNVAVNGHDLRGQKLLTMIKVTKAPDVE
jgi:Cu/Ag efflux protein CusF